MDSINHAAALLAAVGFSGARLCTRSVIPDYRSPVPGLSENAYAQSATLVIVNQTPILMDACAEVVIHEDVAVILPAIAVILQKLNALLSLPNIRLCRIIR